MRRRPFLGAVGAALAAGCSGRSRPVATRTERPTPPANVTTITDTKPLPTPDGDGGRRAALSFVEMHERRFVYNELVGGFGTAQPAISIDVGPVHAAVVRATDRGHYLLSTCSGSARYYDPDGSPSGASRNAASVAHFVGPDTHRRIPFNAYRCREAVLAASEASDRDRETAGARFQIYDFDTPPEYDRPEEGGRAVEVTVSGSDGERVLDRSYRTSLPLTVQPGITETPGTYTLSATLDGGASVRREWTLPDSRTPSWWGMAVLITNGGGIAFQSFYPNETVGVPRGTLCRRRPEGSVDESTALDR
ncbi:hypothetical protein [Halogeometricum luteum]|uniref:Ig-like domain-containing protein n=1 Tax=Halogeometricum luteum TaxID=2950537 RepID=A0ABU2FWZ2_9EURY|nr:hypothetical protein [Halogeometricum sp. S3BR5-2]MDS0293047.1 hypothetical protein [Halogeometricum sp. S3BR5-2]